LQNFRSQGSHNLSNVSFLSFEQRYKVLLVPVGNVALDVVEVLIVVEDDVVDDMVLLDVELDRAGQPAVPPGIYI
jgi:hypothetical protein